MSIKKYCSVENVETWFPSSIFDGNTKISPDEVETLIKNHSATIDSSINDRYTTPVTGEYSLAIVEKICTYMTIADVNDIVDRGLGDNGENLKPTDYRAIAKAMLKDLEDGTKDLPDAVEKTSNNFASYNYDNDVEAVIKKDTTQW